MEMEKLKKKKCYGNGWFFYQQLQLVMDTLEIFIQAYETRQRV